MTDGCADQAFMRQLHLTKISAAINTQTNGFSLLAAATTHVQVADSIQQPLCISIL